MNKIVQSICPVCQYVSASVYLVLVKLTTPSERTQSRPNSPNSMAASLKSKLVNKHGIVPGQTLFDKQHPVFRNSSSLEYIHVYIEIILQQTIKITSISD